MRDASLPLPFAKGARAVFDLSLEGMVWSRRTLLMGLLVGLPVVVAVAYRVVLATHPAARMPPPADVYAVIVAVYWIRNVLPLAALFFATALVADEVEGRTLTYLLTRPLTRASILAGKFAAYLGTTLALALPSVVLTYFVLLTARGWAAVGPSAGDLFRDVGVAALALVAYGGFFALLGVLLKRPVIAGLLFLYGWELMANLPGYLPRFTLTAWLRSLIHHRPAEEGLAGLFQQVLPVGQGLAVLVVASALFLAAAAWIFSTREYVLEQ
ncbi:MAG TPA: ABC transporter permease subunit [Vicinamibacteria bacterium]|nr:ABC transporter permease subunit [Vicinamibacteria bacterium]